jgi:hypothetical protein
LNQTGELPMTKIKYRSNAPGGVMRRLAVPSFKRGGYPEGFPGSPRTLTRDPRKPWQHSGGNPEQSPGSPRTLRKLPCSISNGAVD